MSGLELHVDFDDHGLAAAFERAPEEIANQLYDAVEASADKLQRDWRAGARRSSGTHGRHYPSSITHGVQALDGAITGDIGPDRAKRQGGMGPGFEYGSRNQKPHMDGASAFARNARGFESRVDEAIDKVIGDLE